MADTTTTTFSLTKPEVGASADTWGTKLNTNLDTIDDLLDGTTAVKPNLTASQWKVGGTAITASAAELNYVDGVTSAIQTQLDAKLALAGGTMTGDLLLGANKVGADAGDYIQFTADTQMDFYVNGNNEMRLEADGDLHVDGDVIAYSSTTASSIALKHDVNIIDNALEKLQALKGVSFKYNHDNRESAGVIAEDVQKVLPEAVKSIPPQFGAEKTSLGVNYGALTSILIEAIKELTAKVDKLEKK